MNKETVKKMGDMRLYGMQTAFKTFVSEIGMSIFFKKKSDSSCFLYTLF